MSENQKTSVKTRQQLAQEYGICRKTLTRWLKKEDITISSGLITPREQETIYKTPGKPKNVP